MKGQLTGKVMDIIKTHTEGPEASAPNTIFDEVYDLLIESGEVDIADEVACLSQSLAEALVYKVPEYK